MTKRDEPHFKQRRTEPGTTFSYTTPEGNQRSFQADDAGLVTPRNAGDEAVLASLGVPIARVETKPATKRVARTRSATKPANPPEPVTAPVSETGVTDAGR